MSRTKTFTYSALSGHTRVVIPTGYSSSVGIVLAGAGGGAGGYYYTAPAYGGNGAKITGTMSLSPGDVLDIYLGDGGKVGSFGVVNAAGGAGGGSLLIGAGAQSGQIVVYPVTLSYAWSQFMNDYAVWVNPDGVNPVNATSTITRYIDIPVSGVYTFFAECDNWLNLYVDGSNIINTSDFQSYYGTSAEISLTPGRHTIDMAVSNWGGPAGVAVAVYDTYSTQIWNTRSVLNPNIASYSFRGGKGGNTYGDGYYVYSAAGGGGGASVVYLNGQLVLVAGGGGGGGAEGGHGAGATAGGDGGIPGRVGGSPIGSQGQSGSDGGDIAGTPGGGGGYTGGNAGNFVYYDDAPSLGANGGTNYNAFTETHTSGSGTYTVPAGITELTITLVGGGGGGGGCGANEEPLYTGGGGAGGDTFNQVIPVTPGQQISWTVGSGGPGGGVGLAGYAGLPSTFGGYSAGGGYGGGIPYGANNGTYVGEDGDGWNQAGGAGGYPNGGSGGSYSEDGEYGTSGASGGNGSVTIQVGAWSESIYAGSGRFNDGLSGYCQLTFTELGSGKVKLAGQWKQITSNYVKVAGQWKQITNAYTKVNGEWKVVSGGVAVPSTFSADSWG